MKNVQLRGVDGVNHWTGMLDLKQDIPDLVLMRNGHYYVLRGMDNAEIGLSFIYDEIKTPWDITSLTT